MSGQVMWRRELAQGAWQRGNLLGSHSCYIGCDKTSKITNYNIEYFHFILISYQVSFYLAIFRFSPTTATDIARKDYLALPFFSFTPFFEISRCLNTTVRSSLLTCKSNSHVTGLIRSRCIVGGRTRIK